MRAKYLISKEKALAKGREKLGQVQILAIFLFLLLIPTTMIIAQNSSINQTNITGDLINLPDLSTEIIEIVGNDTNTTINTTTETNQTNQTFPDPPLNVTIPDEWNQTVNETDTNETETNQTDINQTNSGFNETNETIEPTEPTGPELVDPEPTEPTSPILDVGITAPDRVTWRDTVEISAYAINVGSVSVSNVEVGLILPDDFVMLTGSGSTYCEEVAPGTSCHTTVTATVPISSSLGLSEIRARVTYVE